jgi:hypothetical protein
MVREHPEYDEVPTYAGEKCTSGGVIKPIMTATGEFGDKQFWPQLTVIEPVGRRRYCCTFATQRERKYFRR